MKILFVLLRPRYLEYFEPTLRVLAERGHRIHLAFSAGPASGGSKRFSTGALDALADSYPGLVSWEADAPLRDAADGWLGVARLVRASGDLARYGHPRYRDAPLLRERVERRYAEVLEASLPRPLARMVSAGSGRLVRHPSAAISNVLLTLARDAERAIPPSARVVAYIRRHAPDVVLVSPLVDVASAQAEYPKAANALGIPCGIAVASWDNLTNKGVIRSDADAVFVWNEAQRREAVELHDVPRGRVVVTGAPKFDEWFSRSPALDAAAFAERVGLDPTRGYLLYVCSSYFVAPDELGFVERWLEAIRGSADDGVREIGVVVRPHPENAELWRDADLSRFRNAVVYPRGGAAVADEPARADFFHSLAHAAAVVGINTSAMIEAAIVGTGVYTILDSQFRGSQEGTLHFGHLLRERGGVLRVARSLEEHVRQLADDLQGARRGNAELSEFVESFVRPCGIDVPAAPILADAVEAVAGRPAERPVHGLRVRLLRRLLSAVALEQRRTVARDELGAARQSDRVTAKQVELSLASRRRLPRVVLGPWLRDSVEEVLYWVPYLRYLVSELGLERDRLVAVSYGGVAAWYDELCGEYVDLNELLGDDAVRKALASRVPERERLVSRVLATLGMPAASSIPASAMRRVFAGYRRGAAPLGFAFEFSRQGILGPPVGRDGHVAVESSLAELARGLPAALESRVEVVEDGAVGRDRMMASIAGASLFLGTAGGLGLIGPGLGTDTLVVVGADDDRPEPDVDLCASTAQRLGVPLSLLHRDQLAMLATLAGTLTT